jgi:hypothetical protein
MIKWLKYSGVWVTFALNPYHWRIDFEMHGPDDMDPAKHIIIATVGPLTLRIITDDGSY